MGENIGDLGGLEMAYDAYQALAQAASRRRCIDGLTGDQRFFLGWAQVWRAQMRDERSAQPGADRPALARRRTACNGVVRNVDAWYEAFGVPANAKLALPPERRVSIW